MRNLIEELLEATMSVSTAQATLGLPLDWATADLKSAFKKAAFRNHPDRGGSTAKMTAVNAAYKVLQKVNLGSSIGGQDFKKKRADQMKRNGEMVVSAINNLFDPERYADYFTEQTGKPFTFTVKDDLKTSGYSNHFNKRVEWTSSDKETIFALNIYVNLVDVSTVKSLGGEGGVPTLAFQVMLQPTVLHDNRKSKMRRKNWDFSTKQESLVDPTKVFPKSSIKKMMAGKEKKRKFSKRDMLTAIERRLKGKTDHSGGTVWARIPIGEYQLNLYRMTFMKQASWDIHSVRALVNGKWKTFRSKKHASYPEREELIELLKQIQKHTWNDPQALVDTATHQMKSMLDAQIKKDKNESIVYGVRALL